MPTPDQQSGTPGRASALGRKLLSWALMAVLALIVVNWLAKSVFGILRFGFTIAVIGGIIYLIIRLRAPGDDQL
jgi:hypothetical protein